MNRQRIRRYVAYFCIFGLLFSAALVIYGVKGPYFKTEPLLSAFTFSSAAPQRFEFEIDRSDHYLIEIHLSNIFPDKKMDSILGDFVHSGQRSLIDVEWDIKTKGQVIARG
ncbi:MAG: hypothetical protein OES26_22975, partial [Gammaproteobacteria bacterium]|nr:hypothetical protein [Gammaproteobacteria bacterium]